MKIYISRREARIVAICVAVMLVSAMLTQLVLAGTPGGPTSGSPAQQGDGKQQAETQTQPSSPPPYTLRGDDDNFGAARTVFQSSIANSLGAWRFQATGQNSTALSARCLGGSLGCTGTNLVGEAYGTVSQSENTSSGNTSIGMYGISNGDGGQGVAGVNDKIGGYGGVFTATGTSGIGLKAASQQGTSVYAISGVQGAGSSGTSILGSTYSGSSTIGVRGIGDRGYGVFGQTSGNTGGTAVTAGVYGMSFMSNGGLPTANSGVYGTCDFCSGVFGQSDSNVGVRGMATGPANSYGGYFTAAAGTALYGYSTSGFGVYGYSPSSYGLSGGSSSSIGVRGASSSGYGLFITTNTGPAAAYVKTASGNIGLRAINTNTTAGHFAIVADGNVQVNGTLHATGGITAVSPTDQGDKQMYAGVATQNLASDEGSATLVNGRAVVKIDPLFAQTVDLGGGYRVFAMPNSADTLGLGVTSMTATYFEVKELNKGNGNFSFSWRLSAPRKGYENKRMEAAPAVPASPVDKQTPNDLVPLEPSNTPPPVVPQKPGTTSSGALVPVTGKP